MFKPWDKLIDLAKGLSKETAYLLFFLITAMVLGSLISFHDIFSGTPDPLPYLYFFGLIIIVLPSLALIGIKIIKRPPLHGVAVDPDVGDPRFNNVLRAITTGFMQIVHINKPDFSEAVLDQCNIFVANVRSWGRGEYQSEARNDRWLAFLYRNAKRSVFATSIKPYNKAVWYRDTADEIINAHQENKSRVPVKRVFLFDDESSVGQEDIKAMQKQHDIKGISVYVYFFNAKRLPRDLHLPSWDFCIIDDDALGITTFEDQGQYDGNPEARWYFQDSNQVEIYSRARRCLSEVSTPYDEAKKKADWEVIN